MSYTDVETQPPDTIPVYKFTVIPRDDPPDSDSSSKSSSEDPMIDEDYDYDS